MLPAFLAGANLVLHTCGWLESGLVASYEKFVLDIEAPVSSRSSSCRSRSTTTLAFGAHEEIGYGGYFFGAAHTLERFPSASTGR